MLALLGDQIAACRHEIRLARIRAIMAQTIEMQRDYQRLEQQWLKLAETLEFAILISGYIQWSSQRLEPP